MAMRLMLPTKQIQVGVLLLSFRVLQHISFLLNLDQGERSRRSFPKTKLELINAFLLLA